MNSNAYLITALNRLMDKFAQKQGFDPDIIEALGEFSDTLKINQAKRTLYDFGARPETDSTDAIQAALNWSVANNKPIICDGETYFVSRPIVVQNIAHNIKPFGLIGNGTCFTHDPKKPPAQVTTPMFRFANGANFQMRYLILRDIIIKSNQFGGLELDGTANGGNIYLAVLHNVNVDDCSFDGFRLRGAVFETQLNQCRAFDCDNDGMMFETVGGRILSSIDINNCVIAQIGNRGVELLGNCRDVAMFGGYIRDCQGIGWYMSNGMTRALVGVGFENNCRSVAPGNNGNANAHVYANNNVNAYACTFHDAVGGSYWPITIANQANPSSIIACTRTSAGAAQSAGVGKLNLLSGAGGPTVLDNGPTLSPVNKQGGHSGTLTER